MVKAESMLDLTKKLENFLGNDCYRLEVVEMIYED
jgi:hypothetical protein